MADVAQGLANLEGCRDVVQSWSYLLRGDLTTCERQKASDMIDAFVMTLTLELSWASHQDVASNAAQIHQRAALATEQYHIAKQSLAPYVDMGLAEEMGKKPSEPSGSACPATGGGVMKGDDGKGENDGDESASDEAEHVCAASLELGKESMVLTKYIELLKKAIDTPPENESLNLVASRRS